MTNRKPVSVIHVHSVYCVRTFVAGVYLTITMAITTLSMVLTVFVLNLLHISDRPVPPWIKKYVCCYLARMMCMCAEPAAFYSRSNYFRSSYHGSEECVPMVQKKRQKAMDHATDQARFRLDQDIQDIQDPSGDENSRPVPEETTPVVVKNQWAESLDRQNSTLDLLDTIIAQHQDPSRPVEIIGNPWVWREAFVAQEHNETKLENGHAVTSGVDVPIYADASGNTDCWRDAAGETTLRSRRQPAGGKTQRRRQSSVKSTNTNKGHVDFSREWKRVAAIFDRLFFWLFLLLIIITTSILLFPLAKFHNTK